jgi:hypothetical protein
VVLRKDEGGVLSVRATPQAVKGHLEAAKDALVREGDADAAFVNGASIYLKKIRLWPALT